MSFLTEHPTGAYTVLAIIAGVSFLVFLASRRLAHLSGVLLALLLGIGVYVIDTLVVTDREQVEANTRALAKAAQDGDLAALGRLFSERFQMDGHSKASLLARARTALEPSGMRTVQVWDLAVPASDNPLRLQCRCNASASGDFGNLGRVDPPYLGTLELDWEKEGDAWRVTRLVIRSMGGVEQRIP